MSKTRYGDISPADPEWHRRYVRTRWMIQQSLLELEQDPAFQDAEDLGDYVEAMSTLWSFAPRTVEAIEQEEKP